MTGDSYSPDWLNWHALLHKYGKIMGELPINPADMQYLNGSALQIYRRRGWASFRIKLCYYNCQQLRLHDDEKRLNYCEGYADTGNGFGAFEHAWVTINGSVADPTLDAHERGYAPHPYRAYFGIEIPRRQILDLHRCEPPLVQHGRFWEALNIWA